MTEQFELTASDGKTIHGNIFTPGGVPDFVVQVLHGMGEYAGRYATFGAELNSQGIAMIAHDYRGHGPHAEHRGHFADRKGWSRNLEDCLQVNDFANERFPGKPLILFGHSLGSFVAQHFVSERQVNGLVLSGSSWPNKALIYPAMLLAKFESLRHGRRGYSPLLDKLGFDAFNKRFEPADTPYDWLSRDGAQVAKYIEDPLCGGPFTTAFWLDALDGMRRIASDGALMRIAVDLPILITGGEKDPVGGDKGLGNLMLHYAQTAHQRLSIKIYEDARHEMLFETNREQFVADVIEWMRPVAAR